MIISDTLLLLCLIPLSHGLGSLNSLFGDKGSSDSSASQNNMILCTVRHSVHYARVYDTVLVNKVLMTKWLNLPTQYNILISSIVKCHPTSGKGGSSGTEKKCTSKIETVSPDPEGKEYWPHYLGLWKSMHNRKGSVLHNCVWHHLRGQVHYRICQVNENCRP